MRKNDVDIFIEEMETIGDVWIPEQVENVYGDFSLEEAINDRKAVMATFINAIGKIVNRD